MQPFHSILSRGSERTAPVACTLAGGLPAQLFLISVFAGGYDYFYLPLIICEVTPAGGFPVKHIYGLASELTTASRPAP